MAKGTPLRDWAKSASCACGASLNNQGACPRCGGAGTGTQVQQYGGRDYSQSRPRTTPNSDNP
jgi:hypothetical protein